MVSAVVDSVRKSEDLLRVSLGNEVVDAVDRAVVEFICRVVGEGTSLEHELIEIAAAFIPHIDPSIDYEDAVRIVRDIRSNFVTLSEDGSGESANDVSGGNAAPARLKQPSRLGAAVSLQARGLTDPTKNNRSSKVVLQAGGNANATLDRSNEAATSKEMSRLRRMRRAGKDTRAAMESLASVSARNGNPLAGSVDVRMEGVDISFGGLTLLEGAAIKLAHGRRYGVTGRNGIGKSTLLKAIARRELPLPEDMDVLFVEQEVAGDDRSALQCVLDAHVERKELLETLAELEKDAAEETTDNAEESTARRAEIQEVYERLEALGADGSEEARASAILAGLGFDPEMQKRPSRAFSGGWRMRISIASALFVEPKLLLLDEPTNHLDLHTVLWLSDYLQEWPHTIVVVSHDRDFLNEVCTDMVYVKDKKLHAYSGNYNDFERARAEQLKELLRSAESQEMRRKHVQSFVDRFRYNAKRASMAQSRIKLLQKMEENRVSLPSEDAEFAFDFPDPGALTGSHAAIVLAGVSFAYPTRKSNVDGESPSVPTVPQKLLFSNLDFSVNTDSRVALVGANGSGKSTIVKLLLGENVPLSGELRRSPKLRVGYFSQHHVDQLVLWRTPLEHMKVLFPDGAAPELRAHLANLGVGAELSMRPINTLSGGQKSRVALAAITYSRPHLLLLDEPTNHLDIETIDALVEALNTFAGGVLVVSHDSRLLSCVCDEIFVVDNGSVEKFPGDFREYRESLMRNMKGANAATLMRHK
uniref:Probable ATP-dependent transporter ycf16 n=1 Tax=Timspurckia oligopyrenoides TaxID=708627 RepID=A0A7S0ZJ44_9RHOD|mmetsp:Transcript_7294/g.13155  ORF Transcript_7294/g.13155 Transcript_7294/m.13155 type:complete len:759 (+) Transcript_7294:54-2330(+)